MPDLFYDLFMRELQREREKILDGGGGNSLLNGLLQELKRQDVWRRLGGLEKRQDYAVAAVDGGVRTVEFSDGSELIITRAVAVNNYGHKPTRKVNVKYLPVPSSAAYWTYLSISELDAAIECVQTSLSKFERREKYLLMDGSLYSKLTGALHNLILTRGFLDLYYVPEIVESLKKLCSLLSMCNELNVRIVFVSKNSSLKILKDHIVFTTLKDLVREGGALRVSADVYEIFTKGAEWYSIVWLRRYRKKLVELASRYNGVNVDLVRRGIKVAISQSITDTCILEHLAHMLGVSLGISRKLLLGVVDAYMNDKKLTNIDSLMKMIFDRVEDSIMLRMSSDKEAEEYRNSAKELREYIMNIPRILLTYLKFRKDDPPILVEVPIYRWRLFDETIPPKIFYDSYNMWDVIEMLYSEYKDPYHYNRVLWLAHEYANFRDLEYNEYLMAIMRTLKEHVKGKRIRILLVGPHE